MARRAGGLAEQAKEQAIGDTGGPPGQKRSLGGPGAFDAGAAEAVRLRAYYPPTREFRDATRRLKEVSWTEAAEQGATEVTISLDNGDGKASDFFNRLGIVWFVEMKAAGQKWRERLRVVAWEAEDTESESGEAMITIVAYDLLLFLQIAKGHNFLYRKDKKHPKGWTADEVAQDIIKTFKIPVAYTAPVTRDKGEKVGEAGHTAGGSAKTTGKMRIAKAEYRFPYLHMRNVSVYEALARAYTIERKHEKKHYYILSTKGRLAIVRKPAARRILALTPREIRNRTFSRDLTSSLATVVLPLGSFKSNKKRKKLEGEKKAKDPKKAEKTRAKERREEAHNKKRLEAETNEAAALTLLFGNIIVGKRFANLRDPDWTYKEAQRTVNALGRALKTLTISADGNFFIKQGDRIYVRIPMGAAGVLKKELFTQTVTHTITPGDYEMELSLVWREREVDVDVQPSGEELSPGSRASGKHPVEGTLTGAGQYTAFCEQVAEETGLSLRVLGAWAVAEGGPEDNPLNIGPGQHFGSASGAAEASSNLLKTQPYSGVMATAGGPDTQQIHEIAISPWCGEAGYEQLILGVYNSRVKVH